MRPYFVGGLVAGPILISAAVALYYGPRPVESAAATLEGDHAQSCYLVLVEGAPDKLLVLDERERCLHDVKQAYLWFNMHEAKTAVRLYRWSGIFKPTNVESETRNVRAIRMVSPEFFQKLVDNSGGGTTDGVEQPRVDHTGEQAARPVAIAPSTDRPVHPAPTPVGPAEAVR